MDTTEEVVYKKHKKGMLSRDEDCLGAFKWSAWVELLNDHVLHGAEFVINEEGGSFYASNEDDLATIVNLELELRSFRRAAKEAFSIAKELKENVKAESSEDTTS